MGGLSLPLIRHVSHARNQSCSHYQPHHCLYYLRCLLYLQHLHSEHHLKHELRRQCDLVLNVPNQYVLLLVVSTMLQALQKQHMHSLSPSLVHRGSGVASARTRWQPYLALMNQPSQHWITNTPASPAPSTSHIQQAPTPPTDICTPLPQPCLGRPPLRKTASVRDLQKTRHIHALVGQCICSSFDH